MKGALFETLRAPAPIVDIGLNLTHRDFQGDLVGVLQRAAEANVVAIVGTGTNAKSSRKMATAVKKSLHGTDQVLYRTVGVHPHDAKTFFEEEIAKLAAEEGVLAVGECGLDYDRMFSEAKVQREAFVAQLRIAVKLNLPVFLHQRLGFDDFNAIMDAEWPAERARRAVVHCFTGDYKELSHYVKKGYMVGITGFVCKKNRSQDLRHALSSGVLPLTQLMIETDGPFMSPFGKIRRCEPAMLPHIARELAILMNVDFEELCIQTTKNFREWGGLINQ